VDAIDGPPFSEGGDADRRQIALPDGRTMIVRPTTPADVDSLSLLYAGLSADDLHLRFFAVYHPPRKFFEHLAGAAAEGLGYGLVAVVDRPVERIVGEADYFLLDNGNGELAITIAADWRGWLGPYLLDLLIEAAAARGVPNLEAEILVDNRRMLALIRRRGYAIVDGTDFSTLRVSVGATSATPTWPEPHDRPQVLAEVAGGRWRGERAVRGAGLAVMVCPGPQAGRSPHCPALEGRPCPLAAGADVILCDLPAGYRRSDEVRVAHASVHPGTPVLVAGATRTPQEEPVDAFATDEALIELFRRILVERAGTDPRQRGDPQPPG